MKKLYFAFAALAALSFASCQKEQNVNIPEKNMVTVTLVADKAGDETKAAAVEGDSKVTYEWTEADKSNLKLFQVGVGSDGKEALTEVENPTITVSSDNKILTITATVEENTTLRAVVAGELTNTNKPKIKVNQSPAVDNFDPNTDVLVADDVTVSEANELLLTFRRQAVVAKMTLKNMVAGEKVNKVIISAEKDLTGYYEYSEAKMKGQNDEITVKYDDAEVGTSKEFPVYFVTMPNENLTLSITVKTDQYTYTKTFGNDAINFNLGGFARFGVNLSGCGEPVEDTDYTGDWVITGMNGENAYAMMAYVSGNNTPALGVKLNADEEEIATTKVNEIKMHFEKVAEGDYAGMYTIADVNGNYFYAASSSGNQMKADNPTTKTADYYWAVSEESNGTYSIIAEKSGNRNVMQFNSTNSIFSCYASASQKPVTLYPYSWVVEDAGVQPSGDGSLESPFNVAAAVAFTEALGANGTSTDAVYIAGIICQVSQTYQASGNYGNATFFISDDGTASGNQFEAYQVLYLNNQKWTSGKTDIKVGDEVIIYGKVTYYNGTTPETVGRGAAYLYSLNGITGNEQYTITVNPSQNGTVEASATSAPAETEITLTVTPATGYVLDALTVVDASNNAVAVSNNKFTMPAANVTVSATFKAKPEPTGDYYVKVTSADDLTDGEYLIVYEDGALALDGGLTDKLDAVGNSISVTITEDGIAVSDDVDAAAFTYDATEKTLKGAGGLYMGQTSDANGMQSSATVTYENTISFDDNGNANIVSGGAYLRYNSASNQTRFRYYKSGSYTSQKAIALYKK